jgi:hypothetical protein
MKTYIRNCDFYIEKQRNMNNQYETTLASVCATCFNNMLADEWTTLLPLINEAVLQKAHEAGTTYNELFVKHGLQPIQRPLKTMGRIVVKASATRPDVPFKVNSDLCGFRFTTFDVSQIKAIMGSIEECITNVGGLFFVRNSIETVEGKLNDITQCAFAFVPSIGYIAEIQVGHPFAMYTFTQDSIIRDMRLAKVSTEGIVDLWDNDFYGRVKAKILDPSLEVDINSVWPSKDVPISEELQTILAHV